jgi:hypothetical protein
MKRYLITCALLSLSVSSCSSYRQDNPTTVYEDGRGKPHLTLIDIADRSQHLLPWDLSVELTPALTKNIRSLGAIYLEPHDALPMEIDETRMTTQLMRNHQIPLEWHGTTEFVALVEIIDHYLSPQIEKTSLMRQSSRSQHLSIKARLKIFDLRKTDAKLVLSEIVTHEAVIPSSHQLANYTKNHYTQKNYTSTPIGTAHKNFVAKIGGRIHDYVLLAKSH